MPHDPICQDRRTARLARRAGALALLWLLSSGPGLTAPLDPIPLHDWTYDAFRTVIAFVDYRYPMMTLPLTKGEVARVLIEIEDDPPRRDLLRRSRRVEGLFLRLGDELRREMEYLRRGRGNGRFDYQLEWLDRVQARATGADVDGNYSRIPPQECRNCVRGGLLLSHSAGIEEYLGLHVEEEGWLRYRRPEGDREAQVELARGSLAVQAAGIALRAGRESLWWGTGYHGTLLLSDNAPPFDLVQFGALRPFFLPDYWRHVGRVDLRMFLTRLERGRDIPRPWLLGVRATVSPTGYVDLGLTRVVMFGGDGLAWPRAEDWAKFAIGLGEHEAGRTADTNQLLNLEARVSLAFLRRWFWMPFRELQVGLEHGAESAGDFWVRNRAPLLTAHIDFGPVDVRLEWVDLFTRTDWYRHFTYTDGYTYHGQIIGHPTDSQSSERFMQVTGYPAPWLMVRAWWENRSRFVLATKKRQNTFGLELRGLLPRRIDPFLSARYYHVHRHGVGADFPEETTTGLRLEGGVQVDF